MGSSAKSNAVENEPKLLFAQLLGVILPRDGEAAAFQTLGEQGVPGSIPVDELQVVAAPVDEDEDASRKRV